MTKKVKKNSNNKKERISGKLALLPELTAIRGVRSFGFPEDLAENINAGDLIDELEKQINAIQQGDVGQVEKYLYSQAIALDAFFRNMLARSAKAEFINQLQVFGSLALKAQNQARTTLETLARIRAPTQTTFIKQQNNAVNQQVNNDLQLKNSKNLESQANKLLREVKHETLDFGRTAEAGAINSPLETVETI